MKNLSHSKSEFQSKRRSCYCSPYTETASTIHCVSRGKKKKYFLWFVHLAEVCGDNPGTKNKIFLQSSFSALWVWALAGRCWQWAEEHSVPPQANFAEGWIGDNYRTQLPSCGKNLSLWSLFHKAENGKQEFRLSTIPSATSLLIASSSCPHRPTDWGGKNRLLGMPRLSL